MARQNLVEGAEGLQRLVLAEIARSPAAVRFDGAQRVGVGLVGLLQPLARFLAAAGDVEDQTGVEFLEDAVPVRPCELIDAFDGRLGFAGAVRGPAEQQGRGQVGDRPAHRFLQVRARGLVLLLLDAANAERQAGDPVRAVDLDHALGKFHRLIDFAVDQDREEGALEQFAVLRIGAQRGAVIGRGRAGVALHAGMACREIAARRRDARELLDGRNLLGGGHACAARAVGKVAAPASNTAAVVRNRIEKVTVSGSPWDGPQRRNYPCGRRAPWLF